MSDARDCVVKLGRNLSMNEGISLQHRRWKDRGGGGTNLVEAFLVSGARAVVASLWSADDTYTGVLMERLYSVLTNTANQFPEPRCFVTTSLYRCDSTRHFFL